MKLAGAMVACGLMSLVACAGPRWGKVATTPDGCTVRCERGAFVQTSVEWFEVREITGTARLTGWTLWVFEDLDGDGLRGEEEPTRQWTTKLKEPATSLRSGPIAFDTPLAASRACYVVAFTTTGGHTGELSGKLD